MSRKFLYADWGSPSSSILALVAVMAPRGAMSQGRPQLKRPEDDSTGESLQRKKEKKIKEPRAVGSFTAQRQRQGDVDADRDSD